MLTNQLKNQGDFLFRWRSYLPLMLAPVMVVAMRDADQFENYIGDAVDDVFEFASVGIAILGMALRAAIVGFVPRSTSGRNSKSQKAAVLNTTGMYSVVRHPLYLANFLIFLGIMLSIGVWYLAVIGVLAYFLYYERIMCAEEAFLREQFGDAAVKWAERTPTFIPRFSQWRKPALPFSWRSVLRREYSTVLAVVLLFCITDHIDDLIAHGRMDSEPEWLVASAIALVLCVGLRAVKKHTNLLRVEGR